MQCDSLPDLSKHLMNACRIIGALGDYARAAQASLRAHEHEQSGDMLEKAAAAESDPAKASGLLQQAADALRESRNFPKCFELALKHPENQTLFPTAVSIPAAPIF